MTKSIVLTVCEELGVTAEEFFGRERSPRMTNARRVAVERLHEAGFSYKASARLIRRNYSTVQYWLHPKYREHRVNYYRDRRAAEKAQKEMAGVAA